MMKVIDIDGRRAAVSFDREIGMTRGEFLDLSGGADFYAKSVEALEAEGRKSLEVYFDLCKGKGVVPWRRTG